MYLKDTVEYTALNNFKNSIDTDLEEIIQETLTIFLTAVEYEDEETMFNRNNLIKMITNNITLNLKWRYEYELLVAESEDINSRN